MVGTAGETRTPDLDLRRVALFHLSYSRESGSLGRVRTDDLRLVRAAFFQLNYQAMVERAGFEPAKAGI